MLVFWEQKLVLLSVPKTGTTALEGAFSPHADIIMRNPPPLKHAPIYRYRRFLKPLFVQGGGADESSLKTIALVREPVSWLSSWYRYRHRDALIGHQNSTRGISFDDFVLEYVKGKPAPFAEVGSQAKFLTAGDDGMVVDHLYRYEAQTSLLTFLNDRLGTNVTLNQRNVSPVMDTPLSSNVLAKLREKRRAEFDVWEMGQT